MTEPDAAQGDGGPLVVWRYDEGGGGSRIRFGRHDEGGHAVATGIVAGDGALDLGQPDLAWNGAGYGLAYFAHMSTDKDRMEFVEAGADGAPDAATYRTFTVTLPGGEVVGRPAVAWSGTGYAIAWEEAGSTAARLHLTLVPAGTGAARDTMIEDDLAAHIGDWTAAQEGMLDIGWNGRWGLVCVNENLLTGGHVWFVELHADGTLADEPIMVNPSATNSSYPTLLWYETDSRQSWVFAWVQFWSVSHILYTNALGVDF